MIACLLIPGFELRAALRARPGLGLEAVLARALASVGTAWEPRVGASRRRFAALAAASVARPGQAIVVADAEGRGFLPPLPPSLLPLAPERYAELEGLRVRRPGGPGGAA